MPRKKKFDGPLYKLTAEIPLELAQEVANRLPATGQTQAQAIAWGLQRWLVENRSERPKIVHKGKHASHS